MFRNYVRYGSWRTFDGPATAYMARQTGFDYVRNYVRQYVRFVDTRPDSMRHYDERNALHGKGLSVLMLSDADA